MTGGQKAASPAGEMVVPSRAFVSLAEALSWIAFRDFLEQRELTVLVRYDDARMERLEQAAQQFVTVASSGSIRVRGRHVAHFREANEAALADTHDIPANRLKDFCQFDLDVCGLRRRPPDGEVLLWRRSQSRFDREFASYAEVEADASAGQSGGLAEGYREVEALRADLVQVFPISQEQARPSQSEIVAWCREKMAQGITNMNDAWAAFQVVQKYRGLSRDDVLRLAWRAAKTKRS